MNPTTSLVAGLSVSPICMGLGGIGSSLRGGDAQRLMDLFASQGGNFFDTAHCYAFWVPGCLGNSEHELGDFIRRAGRKSVVISTKGGHPANAAGYPRPDNYLDRAVVARDLDESLERLGVDSIDLYYLHRDDPRLPVGEIVDMLNVEVAHGRIRNLGASNWPAERIALANAYAARSGKRPFVVSQPQWNLAEPNPSPDPTMRFLNSADRAWHAQSRLTVMPYTPTASGFFASGGAKGGGFDNSVSRARLVRVEQLAAELNCSANQIALAWLMHQPFPVIPITGTVSPEHLCDAVGACNVALTAEQVVWLENGRAS